jgi:hypothetical protein
MSSGPAPAQTGRSASRFSYSFRDDDLPAGFPDPPSSEARWPGPFKNALTTLRAIRIGG